MLRRTTTLVALLFSLLSINSLANAEEYASATEARAAAVKAMKDFQKASADCRDLSNSKYNLSPSELTSVKLILESSKTLLDDCAVSDSFAEQSTKELLADTGAEPQKAITDYVDYVLEFEAYQSTTESTIDDIIEAIPSLKELGKLVFDRKNDFSNFETAITKFDQQYLSYPENIKNQISATSAWNAYQGYKVLLLKEQENNRKASASLEDLNRLVDIESTLEDVKLLFSIAIPISDLEKSINDIKSLVASKSANFNKPSIAKSSTITCTKGKSVKKVTAMNPKCPVGYKKK